MAEQRTNIDIEDVLSSIRRLVSEEQPRLRRADPLLLTPALRVVEGRPPVRSDAPGAGKKDSGVDAAPVLSFRDRLSAAPVRLADFARAADAQAAPAPRIETPGYYEDLDVVVFGEAEPAALSPEDQASADLVAEPAMGAAAEAPAEPQLPDEDAIAAFFRGVVREELSLDERIADLQAAISHSDEEFEPDGSESPEPLDPQVVRRAEGARTQQVTEAEVIESAGPGLRGTGLRDSGLVEPELAEPAPDDAEDHAGADFVTPAYAEPRMRAERTAEGVYTLRRPGQPQHGKGPAPAPGPEYTEALIDEDSLREIVAELVREELRGELGERITRNVRSLIRRELNRALTLRDLSDNG